jgi:hypothetical protein
VACRLLLDGDRGRQPLDQVDIRFLHQFEELACVCGQRFDVAPLPFGVEGVEGERGLAGARQAGDHDQLFARQLKIDVLEIVRARAANPYLFHHADFFKERFSRGETRYYSSFTPFRSSLSCNPNR